MVQHGARDRAAPLRRQARNSGQQRANRVGPVAVEQRVDGRRRQGQAERHRQAARHRAILEEAVLVEQQRPPRAGQPDEPVAIVGHPAGGGGQRGLETLTHRYRRIARVAQAEHESGIVRGQPIIQSSAAVMRFQHQTFARQRRRVRQALGLVGIGAQHLALAPLGDQQFADDVEHPGRGAAVQAHRGHHARRPAQRANSFSPSRITRSSAASSPNRSIARATAACASGRR